MRAGYPLSKDGKKVHAVPTDGMYEFVGDPNEYKIVGKSLCDHRVELRDDSEFNPTADDACSRCAAASSTD